MYVGCTREIGRRVIEEGHRQGLTSRGILGYMRRRMRWRTASIAWSTFGRCSITPWHVAKRRDVRPEESAPVQLVAAIKEHHVAVDPTLVVHRNMLLLADQPEFNQHPDNAKAPERMREYWQRRSRNGRSRRRRWQSGQGIPQVPGSCCGAVSSGNHATRRDGFAGAVRMPGVLAAPGAGAAGRVGVAAGGGAEVRDAE